ncbi:MAG: 30S ribosomal protein S5 [Patescibacteria group bacterium]
MVTNNQNNQRRPRDNNRRDAREEREYDQTIVDISRVTRVMAGGKRMRFRACLVIGDHKGKVGAAVAKGADVTLAVNKALVKAKKNMVTVPMINETIPHQVLVKSGAARILLKPAPKGTGIIAGGAVRVVLDLAGVSNVVAKALGSKNKLNNVNAALKGLRKLKRIEPKVSNKQKESKKTEEVIKEKLESKS